MRAHGSSSFLHRVSFHSGSYSLLLNTTSKPLASLAASLTLLSYVATAVVTAVSAMQYLHELVPDVDVFWSVAP